MLKAEARVSILARVRVRSLLALKAPLKLFLLLFPKQDKVSHSLKWEVLLQLLWQDLLTLPRQPPRYHIFPQAQLLLPLLPLGRQSLYQLKYALIMLAVNQLM